MKKRLLLGLAGLLLVGTIVPAAFALNDKDDKVANVTNLPVSETTLAVDMDTATELAPALNNNTPNNVDNEWLKGMFDWHNSRVDAAEKNGQITPGQANDWREHMNYMREFHSKNGFGMMGGCAPAGNGMMGGYYPQQ